MSHSTVFRTPVPFLVLLFTTVWCVSSAFSAPTINDSGAKKLGWKLAIQAWTNNRGTLFETLELAQRLGLHYLEAFPGQRLSKDFNGNIGPGMSAEQLQKLLDKAKSCGVTIINYGVTGIPEDEAGARKMFEWARKVGIKTLVSEPKESQIPLLDKLAQEYDMTVAIHDHPKPSHYWNPEFVLKAVAGASNRIGACADTGHWMRSGLDPIECLKKLQGRVISLHFKDLNQRDRGAHDVPWGTGASDVAGQMAELKRQSFKGVFSIEYEHKWDEATLAKCVSFFYEQANKLAAE